MTAKSRGPHLVSAKDDFLCDAAAHAHVDVRAHLLPRPAVLILLRRLPRTDNPVNCKV